jgi:GrpB-like predicted nucleotidyltransferase (UPF0157 family)
MENYSWRGEIGMASPGTARRQSEEFLAERARLLAALGHIPSGGIVEAIEHVGPASVPGLPGGTCIDIALSIGPFPLQAESQAKLEGLGYSLSPDAQPASQQVMIHAAGAYQLFMLEAGSSRWSDFRILREFWKASEEARHQYVIFKQAWRADALGGSADYHAAKESFFSSVLPGARKWWIEQQGFRPLDLLLETMRGFEAPWLVGGGWALDLFLGRAARVHDDVDVVISMDDQLALQAHMLSKGWSLVAPSEGRMEPWKEPVKLDPGQHQVHTFRDGAFIDFLLSPIHDDIWHYRRDREIIRSMARAAMRNESGTPFLAPELVLLFKSRNTSGRERSKDPLDFERIHPLLEPERRAWLLWALQAINPEHPWIEKLALST